MYSFWCKLGYLTPALVRVWPGYTVVNVPTGNYVTINAFGGHTELRAGWAGLARVMLGMNI